MSSVERSAMDSKLLSLARRSPVEIAELTGLDAGFVASRISELLASRSWLSERQEERLLLEEVIELKDAINYRLHSAEDKDFAAVANVALRSMKLISERLDSRKKLIDQDIQSITQAQAKIFGKAFDIALSHIVAALGDGADSDFVDATVRDALKKASAMLDESVKE